MKKIRVVLFIVLIYCSMGFTNKILPMEGIYDLQLKVLTLFDLLSKDIALQGNLAELTESQPNTLNLNLKLENLIEPTFGSVKLGNTGKKTWFLMSKGKEGVWSEIFIDQNGDNIINEAEKIKGIETYEEKKYKYRIKNSITNVPIPIQVTYKGVSTEFEKKMYFFLSAYIYSTKSDTKNIVTVSTASFLEGEMKVLERKQSKLVKFRIYDINGNGCFNNYGEDMIHFDSNYDGFFKKKEGQKLTEFFDYTSSENPAKQYRFIVVPQPAKVAIMDSFKEYDWSQLEASSDIKQVNSGN